MVAVVSGNGLGLFNTSLTQLGSALGGPAGLGQSRESQFVNIATGNLILQDQDENLLVRGFNTSFLRTYNSRGSVAGQGQDGFITGYERHVALTTGTLNAAGSQMTLYTGDGQAQVFVYSGTTNKYTSTAGDGATDTLTYSSVPKTWAYVEGSSQRQEVYEDHASATLLGRLKSIKDLKSDGTTPAEYDLFYDASNRVTEVRSVDDTGSTTSSDALLFTYDGSGRLSTVTTREGTNTRYQLTYNYDAYGRLSEVINDLTPIDATGTWNTTTVSLNDTLRFRTGYTYVTASASDLRIASVTQSDGTVTSYTYESDGGSGYRVKTVTLGDTNTNDADGAGETVTFTYTANQTTVTDSLGRVWTYKYDASQQLTEVDAPAISGLSDVTTYTYNASGDVTQIKTSRGGTTLSQKDYAYDTSGNVTNEWTLVSGTAATAVVRTYNTANQVLTETRYTGLDSDGSGATAPTGTALVTNYTYDTQNRLRFVTNAAGEVSEYVYATSGNGIGQAASVRQYIGAVKTSGLFGLSAMQSWASTTQKASSLLTEYTYDAKGRLSQTTAYGSVDSSGNGAFDTVTDITRFTYDAQGLLLNQTTVRGASRTLTGAAPSGSEVIDYVYDGLGRLLSVLKRDSGLTNNDANTVATTYVYTDSGKQIVVTLDTGATSTQNFNAAHRLTSSVDSGTVNGATVTRTTSNYYDAAGQLRATQDATGARTYLFYDAEGRLSATVDGTGAVSELRYDGAGRIVQTVGYATRVDTSAWLSGSSVVKDTLLFAATQPGGMTGNQAWVPTDATNDRSATKTYDTAGRLATEVDAAGSITTYTYDGVNELTQVTVTDSAGTQATARTTRFFYDAASRQLATLDAEGYLVENTLDYAGRLVKTVRYATLTNSTYWASGTLAQLRPSTNGNDQSTRLFYDGRGNLTGTLSAEGYLTEYVYDEAANQRAVKAYAKQLTGLTGSETLSALRTLALTSPPTESLRLTQRSFNGLGQLTTELNYEGTVTYYTYDEAGRLVRTESAQGQSEVREDYRRYDVFGNLIGEVSGKQAADAVAYAQTTYGKALTDPTLTDTQLNTIYAAYGVTHSYDLVGRRIESVDAAGNKTWYFYDASGRQTFVVRGVNDSNNIQNAQGEVTETRYNAFGQVSDSLAYTGRITIATPGSRTSVQSAITALSVAGTDTRRQMAYDQRGLLKQLTDAEGVLSTYSYTAFGQLYQEQRAVSTSAAVTIQHSYDKRGLETGRTDALGAGVQRAVSQTYDAFGRVISSTDARGDVDTYTYDRLGRQVTHSQVVTIVGGTRTETFTTAYDAYDRTVSVADALGKVTGYAYSDTNRTVTITTPENVQVQTVHNRFGQTVTVTTAYGTSLAATTTTVYDKNGAVLSVTDALGQVNVTNVYDVRGLLTETTDANGNKVDFAYDAVGRMLTRIVDPGTGKLNLTTTYAYDGQGRTLSVTDPTNVVTQYSYDREGRLTQTVVDAGSGKLNLTTTYTYDAVGRTLTVTEGAGTAAARTTQYVYDVLGRRTSQVIDPGSGKLNLTTSYVYDNNDNLIKRTDGNGNVTHYAYDEANRLVYTVDPINAVTRTTYDADGRVVGTRAFAATVTLTSGDLTTLETATGIGGLNLLAGKVVMDDTKDAVVYRTYDRDGRLRFVIDSAGDVTETTYDTANRVAGTRAYATAINFVTNAALLTSLKAGTAIDSDVSSKVTVDNAHDQQSLCVYDIVGQCRYALTRADASTMTVTEHRYDAAGRTIGDVAYAVTIASSTATTVAAVAAAVTAAGGDVAAQQRQTRYVYDNAGRLRYSIDDAGAVTEQVFDADSRVSKVRQYPVTITISNPTESTVAAAVAGQSGVRETTNTYDNAGRLTQVSDALSHNDNYTYDALGHVLTHTDRTGATWTYVYDAAGRKTQERSPQVSVARFDATGAVVIESKSVVTNLVYDALGNVTSRTDNAEAANTAERRTTQYQYDARGLQIRTIFPDAGAINSTTGAIDTTGVTPDTVVTYNSLSQAVVQKDVRGNYSYKIYDALGRLAYDIDAEGYVTGYSYNALNQQTVLTRYANKINTGAIAGWTTGTAITLAQIVGAGVLTPSASADRTLTSAFDSRGNKLSVTQKSVTYYRADGTSTTGTPMVQFTYDAYGQVVKESVLLEVTAGGTSVWADTYRYYDDLGRETMCVDAEGYVTTRSYDALGQVTQLVEFANWISTSSLSTTTKPALPIGGNAASGFDRISQYGYDALGRKTSETVRRSYTQADGSTGLRNVTTALTYDNEGRLLTTTVDGVLTTTNAYDAVGHMTSVQEAVRDVLRSDAETQLLATTAKDLNSAALYEQASPYTATVYDAFGNTVQVTRYANGMRNGVLTADATRDQVSINRYDWQGRAVLSIDPEGNKTYSTFDAADHVLHQWHAVRGSTSATDAVVHAYYVYDKTGRQTETRAERVVGAAPAVVDRDQFAGYNAFGEITAQATSLANLSNASLSLQSGYDAVGRMISSNQDTGTTRNFGYNLAGFLVWEQRSVSELNGTTPTVYNEVYRQVTDHLGRTTVTYLPSYTSDRSVVTTVVHTLDRWGNVLEEIDPRGYRTRYEYNEFNSKTRQIAPQVEVVGEDGNASWQSPETHWMYDALGRLIATRDANGNVHQSIYNSAGQAVRSIDGTGAAIQTAYDALDNERMHQDPRGYLTWQSFDKDGRVTAMGDYLPDITGALRQKTTLQQYTLSQDGQRVVVTDAMSAQAKYDFDAAGLLLHSVTAMGVAMDYGYDLQGHKIRETDGLNTSQTWTYDVFGRVTAHADLSAKTYGYTYNGQSGQLTNDTSTWGANRTTAYYANGLVRRIDEGSNWYIYEYDANGNRTYEETYTVDGSGFVIRQRTRTTYDSNNRIARVFSEDLNTTTGAPIAVIADVRYGYDAVGNRRVMVADTAYGNGVTSPSAANQAPVVIGLPDSRSVKSGINTQIRLRPMDVFQDPEQFTLGFSATLSSGAALPSWLTLSSAELASTGELVFTVDSSATAGQSAIIRLKATDASGAVSYVDFTVTVVSNTAPVSTGGSTPVLNLKTGVAFASELPMSLYFKDNDAGDTLTYTVTAGAPAWLSVDSSTAGTLRLSGVPTSAGTYNLTVQATDGSGATVTRTVTLSVAGNAAPVAVTGTIATQYALIGRDFEFSRPLDQLFTDANGDALTITATLSGGGALPAWLNLQVLNDTNPPTVRLVGQVPPDATAQTLSVVLTATDPNGANVSRTISVQLIADPGVLAVVNPITDMNVAATGATWSYTISTSAFASANNVPLSYSVTGMPSWMSFDANTRTFSGTPSTVGSWNITVTASAAGESVSDTFTFTTPNTPPIQALTLSSQNAVVNTSWSFTFAAGTFVDYNNQTLTYTATGLPPGVTFNGSTRTFSGTPTTLGTYTITVTASDGTLSTSGSFNVSVNNAGNQPPIVNIPLDDQYTTTSSSFFYQFPTNSFTDPEGQTLTYTATQSDGSALPGWLSFNASTRTFSGTTPSSIRQYTIRVKATDPAGNFITDDFLLEIDGGGQFAMFGGDGEITMDGASSLVLPANTVAQHWGVTAVTTPYAFNTANTGGAGTRNAQLSWFTYDGENRTVITNGTLSGTQILTTGGYEQLYDAAGNAVVRVTVNGGNTLIQRSTYTLRGQLATQLSTQVLGQTAPTTVVVRSTYDAAGRLLENRRYFGASTWVQYVGAGGELMTFDASGWLDEVDQFTYDADGRQLTQTTKSRVPGQTSTTYTGGTVMIDNWVLAMNPETADITQQTTDLAVLNYAQNSVDFTAAGTGYDAAGRVIGYKYSQAADSDNNLPAFTWSYTYTYEGHDAWLEKDIGGTGTGDYRKTTSTSYYDAYARRFKIEERTKLDGPDIVNQKFFAYDANGGILSRRDGYLKNGNWVQADESNGQLADPVPQFIDQTTWGSYTSAQRIAVVSQSKDLRYAYSNGEMIAAVGQAGNGLDARSRLTAYSSSDNGDTMVTVQDGDTLAGIAQRVYGNSSLGYVIGMANAIDNDNQLVVGTQLKVPSVTVSKNDAHTFKPYDPNQIIGPTAPSLPNIPPPPDTHCQALSTVIGIVVAVIVTIYSGNPVAGAAAGNDARQFSSAVLNGQFDWGALFKGVLNPVNAAATFVVMQNPLLMMWATTSGNDRFQSWVNPLDYGMRWDYKSTAIAAASAYLTGGISNPYLQAAASYATNYQLSKWAGYDVHWSNKSLFASVAATYIADQIPGLGSSQKNQAPSPTAGAGATVSASTGAQGFSWSSVALQTAQNLVRSVIQYGVQRAIGDRSAHWNTGLALADAFGNALGSNIKAGIESQRAGGSFFAPPPTVSNYGAVATDQSTTTLSVDMPASGRLELPDSDTLADQVSQQMASTYGNAPALDEKERNAMIGALNGLYDNPDSIPHDISDAELIDEFQSNKIALGIEHPTASAKMLDRVEVDGGDLTPAMRQAMDVGALVYAPKYYLAHAARYSGGQGVPPLLQRSIYTGIAQATPAPPLAGLWNSMLARGVADMATGNNASALANLLGYIALPQLGKTYAAFAPSPDPYGSANPVTGEWVGGMDAKNERIMSIFSLLSLGMGGAEVQTERAGANILTELEGVADRVVEVPARGSPAHLISGQSAEAGQLATLNSSGKVPFTPTPDQVNSASFRVIVGEPKYTRNGDLVGTIFDGMNQSGLAELKNGSSMLDSSYQLRLQTYGALVNDVPLTIYTSRQVNPTFLDYLTRWGVSVKPLPH